MSVFLYRVRARACEARERRLNLSEAVGFHVLDLHPSARSRGMVGHIHLLIRGSGWCFTYE